VNGPGILVFQETFGVNDYIRDIARRFADIGITAIAPELYHRTLKGPPIDYDDVASARPHSAALTVESMALDIQAAYDWLKNDAQVDTDRVAAVGFCQGGRTAYIANAYLPLAGAISFYGGRMHEALHLAAKQHGPNLMFWGGLDKNILAEHRRAVEDALTAAGKNHQQVLFSYAEHGFFCDERADYSAEASHIAWATVLEFLRNQAVL
jgi:carboxymethylenebutenolidase